LKIELSPKDIENLENAAHQAKTFYTKCGLTIEKDMLDNTMNKIASQKAMNGKQEARL